ncbi:Regulatory protein AfsR [Pelagimonas phthalicica]|uniref:Regulatory protein AfsR n=1 Tax=Pelagimonas phthalicica TaxID=1037362 RepID=A0A238JFP8_9RHOB|nr:toll/interleukin-1 receptor domain-containing protein [Pelagimonas phthalicica]SMX29521.1 Regulatory protein AfsR [Pelagimonas phthalicica]
MTSEDQRAFISYARSDGSDAATRFLTWLSSHGFSGWQDLREIGSDETVWPQIETALKKSDVLVVIVTCAALASEYIRREWRAARRYGATIIPVLGEEISRSTLPRWLRREEVYRLDDPHREAVFLAIVQAPRRRLSAVWDDGLALAAMVPRPGKLSEAKTALLADDGGPVALSSVLAGRGGFGKTTLAAYVAQDPDIRDAFLDGVFWVAIGRQSHTVLTQIEEIIRKISGARLGTTDEDQAAQELKNLLDHRDVLIIVDDVWREAQLRPFVTATENAALLVTTRNKEIAGPDTDYLDVEAMSEGEALELLSRDLPGHRTTSFS